MDFDSFGFLIEQTSVGPSFDAEPPVMRKAPVSTIKTRRTAENKCSHLHQILVPAS